MISESERETIRVHKQKTSHLWIKLNNGTCPEKDKTGNPVKFASYDLIYKISNPQLDRIERSERTGFYYRHGRGKKLP